MKPGDIDYAARRQHFFDIANGEVLAGSQDRRAYLAKGNSIPDYVLPLGSLLRDTDLVSTLPVFEAPDLSSWPDDRFAAYGRWINSVVEPPKKPHENKLTRQVFENAHHLGLGPSRSEIIKRFGAFTHFYDRLGTKDASRVGRFNDWSLEEFIAYIKSVGGENRPSREDIKEASHRSRKNPSDKLIHERFKPIGGFKKVVELSGYAVVRLWERQDYIDWGVRFMKANGGTIPSARMMNFFASGKIGPSDFAVKDNFGTVNTYQNEVVRTYWEAEAEEDIAWREKLTAVEDGLRDETLPFELFVTTADLPLYPQETDITKGVISSLENISQAGGTVADMLVQLLGKSEFTARYARYIVVQSLTPDMDTKAKVRLAVEETGRNFTSAFRQRHPELTAGDIEYAALVNEVFDDIWPTNDYLARLKLGGEYEIYREALNHARKERERKKLTSSPAS